MLKMFASEIKYSQLVYRKSVSVFLLLYAAIVFALSGSDSIIFDHLHLLLDTINGILSLMLALFLLAEQSNIQPNVRKYLAIGFAFAAASELFHAFVGIEWEGWFSWISGNSSTLRAATWPPSTYILPLSLVWAMWLMRRNSAMRPAVFAAGMGLATFSLYVLVFIFPPYFDTGVLGIQRPTQIPALFLLLVLIAYCWRERHRSSLFEGLAWMSVLLFFSDLFMLYATSPFEKFTMMAHAGKLLAYTFLHVIQMRLAVEDSQARGKAEAALMLEKKNLRDAMDELVFHQFAIDQHSIVGTTDVQGNITYANNSFCSISGYSREELMGQNHRLLKSGQHPTEFFRDMYRTIAAGDVWKGEICNRAKDGHLYWVMTTIVPVVDDQGKPKQYISLRSEITARKQVETELILYQDHLEELVAEQILDLKQAKETAEAANRAKSEFLANMSHEIRTPMNGVVGVVDILQETQLTPAQQRMVHTIRTSSLALMGILGDILDLSKIEAGKLEIEKIPVNLRELVEGVAQLLAPTVADQDMDLIVFLPPEIPAWVSTDPGRLRQILFNLLSNAVKFTQSGENWRGQIMLRVEMKRLPDDREVLHFRIIDNGIGMSQGTMAQLFRPFAQEDATTTRRFGGTGLGLSISKNLAELMQGQIYVSSVLGGGSEFTLELPLKVAPASHATAVLSDLSGMKVLIVTDQPVYEEILSAYLNAVGAQIEVVPSQQAALNVIHQSGEKGWEVLLDMTRESDTEPEIANSIRTLLPGLPIVPLVSRRISSSPKGELVILANPLMLDDLMHTLALATKRIAITDIVQTTERRSQPRQLAPTVEEAVANGQLILVAEDNETNLEVIQEQLRILGYASESAEDGRVALEKWRRGRGRYSLLFTDCHMPNLDGFGLTAAIRKEEPEGERLRIIAVTGNAMQGEAQRCLVNGMDDYLAKPLRLSDLGSKLAKWLPLKQPKVVPEAANESRSASVPAEQAAAEVVWDAGTLTRMVGDHPEMHRRLLDKFLPGAEEQVAAIMSAVAAGDMDVVVGVAHKMKSAARTVGALRLGQLCQELESAGRADDIDTINSRTAALEAAFQDAAGLIKSSFGK
ncbi:MAG TPA: ATP-binding protein [Gallionellaceae bacterium]|nr:ATP-binding protein [Gallionellaceae bacterium]